MANPFETDGAVITDLHWFSQHNGAKQWLIWTTDDGELRFFNGSITSGSPDPWTDIVDAEGRAYDGAAKVRKDIRTPWQGQSSQAWGGRLYLVNGFNEAIVFDGDKAERAGFSARPQAPYATPVSDDFSTTLTDIGLGSKDKTNGFKYVVTFVNERGQESQPSPASEMVTIINDEDSRRFAIVQIPRGPEEAVARRLYRTRDILNDDGEPLNLGFGDQFFFLREFQDNEVDHWEDGIPDGNLASILDPLAFGPYPAGTKYLAVFKNTMWATGATNNEVQFSAPFQPEVFPPDNVLQIGDDDMSPPTAMYPTKNALVIFKQRGIYLIKGDPSGGFSAQTLTRDFGCAAPRSVAELPGLGLVFLGNETINLLEGALENTGTPTAVRDIGTQIQDFIERINKSAVIQARSVVYHRDREYWLALPTIGSDQNNLVLVYHYEVGTWTIRKNFPIKCMVETRDHRGYLLFGSHETGKLGIHAYSRGWEDKGGVAITSKWESVHHDLGSVYQVVQPLHINAYVVAYGDNDLEITYRINRSIDNVETARVRDQQSPGEKLGVYDTALWGGSKWGFFRPTVLRIDPSTRHKERTRELQVAFAPTGRRIQLVAYDIEIQAGEQQNIKPIDTIFNPGIRG